MQKISEKKQKLIDDRLCACDTIQQINGQIDLISELLAILQNLSEENIKFLKDKKNTLIECRMKTIYILQQIIGKISLINELEKEGDENVS